MPRTSPSWRRGRRPARRRAARSSARRCAATCTRTRDWSDGGSPIEEMAFTAMELGHDYLVLTDHSPRLTVANGLSAARLTRQLEVVDAVNEHLGGTALPAAEGHRGRHPRRRRARPDRGDAGRLDVRVASVHSKLKMDRAAMTRRMVAAVHNPCTNVLGHCTGRLVTGNRGTRRQSRVRRRGGVRGLRRDRHRGGDQLAGPSGATRRRAAAAGDRDWAACSPSTATPTRPGQLDFQVYGCARAEELGLDPDRIVNTWPRRPAAGLGPAGDADRPSVDDLRRTGRRRVSSAPCSSDLARGRGTPVPAPRAPSRPTAATARSS